MCDGFFEKVAGSISVVCSVVDTCIRSNYGKFWGKFSVGIFKKIISDATAFAKGFVGRRVKKFIKVVSGDSKRSIGISHKNYEVFSNSGDIINFITLKRFVWFGYKVGMIFFS